MLEPAYANCTKGQDVERVVLMGCGAGGGLALSLAMAAWREGLRKPDQLYLLSPMMDTEFFDKSLEQELIENSKHAKWTFYNEHVKEFLNSYWVRDYAVKTEYTSPYYGDMTDICDDVVLFSGVQDLYHCYAREFYKKAKKAGVNIRFFEFEDEAEDFMIYDKTKEYKKAQGFLIDCINGTFDTSLRAIYPLKMMSDWSKKYPEYFKDDWASRFIYDHKFDFTRLNPHIRALAVVDLQQNAWMEQATTRCNLAQVLLQLAGGAAMGANGQRVDGTTASTMYEEALQCLERALRIFEWDGKRDFHYSTALAMMGDALCMREAYVQGADYYMQAMQEMEKHVGKSNAYLEIEERYKQAKYYAEEMKKEEEEEQTAVLTADMKTNPSVKYLTNIVHMGEVQAETVPQEIGTKEAAQGQSDYVDTLSEDTVQPNAENNWLHICKRFYELHGAKMIHEEFPNYEARIAVGLVGE